MDIVHYHSINLWALPSMLAAKAGRKKLVIKMTSAGADDPGGLSNERLGMLKSSLFHLADAVVGVSTALCNAYLDAGFSPAKLHHLFNAVDTTRFAPITSMEQKSRLRHKLGLPQDTYIAVFVGFVNHTKGVDLLIETWAKYLTKGGVGHLIIVGDTEADPPFFRHVLSLADEYMIEDKVDFTGRVDNVDEYLKAADVFVLSSRREGLPGALIEAMAAGLPCVASDIPGITSDLIQHGVNGYVARRNSTEALANGIKTVLSDSKLASLLGRNARSSTAQSCSIESIAGKYMALYKQLLGAD